MNQPCIKFFSLLSDLQDLATFLLGVALPTVGNSKRDRTNDSGNGFQVLSTLIKSLSHFKYIQVPKQGPGCYHNYVIIEH